MGNSFEKATETGRYQYPKSILSPPNQQPYEKVRTDSPSNDEFDKVLKVLKEVKSRE